MKLLVISHKECWIDSTSPSGHVTVGGFPLQMKAISHLFNETKIMATLFNTPRPAGAIPLEGHCLTVDPLPAPVGKELRRKLALITWLPRHLVTLWRAVARADAIHAPVPGDIGLIGILIALAQRKRLFVRHCGTWGQPATVVDRFLFWLLQRIAGGHNVVMATGGGPHPPSAKNPNIQWIHSTTLSQKELAAISPARSWRSGQQLKLVTVGRLSASKNTHASLKALARIRQSHAEATLDIVGAGPQLASLQQLAAELDLEAAVTFHGNVPNERVLEILPQMHIFLFPTQVREGFPKAVLEAMACGLPVVATAVSVLPHLIGRKHGRLLPEPTPTAVAEAVLALTADEAKLAEMARSARQASKAYTLEAWQETIARRLAAAWGEALQSPSTL